MNYRERLYGAYVTSKQAGQNFIENISPEQFYAKSSPYINYVIKKFIPQDKSIRILDLGCGHGDFIYYLKKHGYKNINGVDISKEQVDIAHHLGLKTEVIHGTIESFLSSINDPFDIVIMFDILEHLTRDELFATLDLIYSKISTKGKLIIHVPNGEGIYGQRIRFGDLTHELCFTPKSINQLMLTVGFSKTTAFEDKPIPHNLKSRLRRFLWNIFTIHHRITLMAETGQKRFVLSQNMLVIATK